MSFRQVHEAARQSPPGRSPRPRRRKTRLLRRAASPATSRGAGRARRILSGRSSTAFAHCDEQRVLDEVSRLGRLRSDGLVGRRRGRRAAAAGLPSSPRLRPPSAFPTPQAANALRLAHGEALSRFRYSVHAVLASAVNDSADAARARLNHASFNDGSNRRARSAAARARGRSSGRRPEPRAFELHGRDVAQISCIRRLFARRRQERMRGIVVAARQELRHADRVQLRRRFPIAERLANPAGGQLNTIGLGGPAILPPSRWRTQRGMREPPG